MCFKHGKMCEWRDVEVTLFCGSFVCGPYSSQNPKRGDPEYDPTAMPGECKKADTFHHCRDAIKKTRPLFFVLENVDGVTMTRSKSQVSPLTWMLDDADFGLRTQCTEYSIEVISGVKATSVGLPQERPRTLFFGVRGDTKKTAGDVLLHFKALLKSAESFPVHHVDQFAKHTTSRPLEAMSVESEEYTKDHVEYCQALKKAMEGEV
jgi:site-specific DNA-cytosine methylase